MNDHRRKRDRWDERQGGRGEGGRDPRPEWDMAPDDRGAYVPGSPLFTERQDRFNDYERSWHGDEIDYGRRSAWTDDRLSDYDRMSSDRGSRWPGSGAGPQPREGYARQHMGDDGGDHGPRHSGVHRTGYGSPMRSRSMDPGQSSYGGFMNEDPRHQAQQFEREPAPRIMPKGYSRSDERIREDLCEQLSYSGLQVSDVEVGVADGVVKLEGNVPDRHTKHAIEDYADGCMGVKDIENHIRVARPSM